MELQILTCPSVIMNFTSQENAVSRLATCPYSFYFSYHSLELIFIVNTLESRFGLDSFSNIVHVPLSLSFFSPNLQLKGLGCSCSSVSQCLSRSARAQNSWQIVQTITQTARNNSTGSGQKQKCLSAEFLLATKTKPLVEDYVQLQIKRENKIHTWHNLIWQKWIMAFLQLFCWKAQISTKRNQPSVLNVLDCKYLLVLFFDL